MPLLLYTYLTAEILGPFFASLLIINAILFLGKLSSFLDVIFGLGVGFADFARISIYILPNLLLFSIPMSCTLGVIIAFTRMTDDNEILALKAAGISLYRLLIPVIIVALFGTGLTTLTSTKLIPASNMALKQTFYQLAREKIDKGFKAREFNDNIKDVVVYVDQIDKKTKQWLGVFISDQRDRQNPLTIIANEGSLNADLNEMTVNLILNNGTIHRQGDTTSQTIRFGSYNLVLPITTGATIKTGQKNNLSPTELLDKAAELRAVFDKDQEHKAIFLLASKGLLIEFHLRFALAVGCLILTILALPLALQSKPGRSKAGLPLGLLFFFIYYIMLSFAKSMAETAPIPISLIMWLPNLGFGILTLLIVRNAARGHSVKFIDKCTDSISQLLNSTKKTVRGNKE